MGTSKSVLMHVVALSISPALFVPIDDSFQTHSCYWVTHIVAAVVLLVVPFVPHSLNADFVCSYLFLSFETSNNMTRMPASDWRT